MNAIQQLDDALQERNKKTNEFLEEIIAIINESVANLPFCTRANSTPEVEGSVKILRRDLDEIIAKIKDDRNIDKHAAEALVSRLKFTNLKKSPSGLTPRTSEVDAARFSADFQIEPNDAAGFNPDLPPRYEPKPSNQGQPGPEYNGGKRTRTRRR